MIQNAQELQDRVMQMQKSPKVIEQMIAEMSAKDLPLHTPCLKVQVSSSQKYETFDLDQHDVKTALEVFGPVQQVTIITQGQALVLYRQIISAYLAQKYLDGKWLEAVQAILSVQWYFNNESQTQQASQKQFTQLIQPPQEITQHNQFPQDQLIQEQSLQSKQERPSAKFTCRYDIQIENDQKFQVAKRVIGAQGSNMKRIVDVCSKDMPLVLQSQDIVKLRLRGKGSGFKEGPYQSESNEPLHLCISSRYYDKYLLACEECEALLNRVYIEWYEFCFQNNIKIEHLSIKRNENPTQNVLPISHNYQMSDILDIQEIEYWIQIRNEARRVMDFNEADRIREMMNQRGVILIDTKGVPCATSWKYAS